jgi:putative transport protein
VTGSLLAGVAVGQFAHVPVSGMAKSFLFLLFLFGIGYSVGPQFMQALKRDGLKPVALALVVGVSGLCTAIVVAKVLGLDAGFAAGLLSGALTESPAMGTATEAINRLPLPEAERARLVAHIAVADAVCYLFGAAGAIWFISTAAPRLIGVDITAASRTLEKERGIERAAPGQVSAWRRFELRAYPIVEGGPHRGRRRGNGAAAAAVHPSHPSRRRSPRRPAFRRAAGRRRDRGVRPARAACRGGRPAARGDRGSRTARHAGGGV